MNQLAVDYSVIADKAALKAEGVHNAVLIAQMPSYEGRSITNGAHQVIQDLYAKGIIGDDTSVFYLDSINRVDRILHDGPAFIGFAPSDESITAKHLKARFFPDLVE